MLPEEYNMHLRAGRFFGKLPACGTKINLGSESTATKIASKLSVKNNSKKEAYPCYWCDGWHVGRALTEKERQIFSNPELAESAGEGEYVIVQLTDPVWGMQLGQGSLKVHSSAICSGEFCSVHNPSKHPLNTHPLNWRADIRVMERICDHGVGHPDPDDAAYRKATQGNRYSGAVHDCDGCCSGNYLKEESGRIK